MNVPPSLPNQIAARSFIASNGEVGIRCEDVGECLTSCEHDHIAILGGEAWLADHRAAFSGDPVPAAGQWCGLMPVVGEPDPAVFVFDVAPRNGLESWEEFVRRSVAETHAAVSRFDPDQALSPDWRPHYRLNFLLEADAEPVAPREPPPRASGSEAPDSRTLDSLPVPGSSGGR